jgi:hypothetical protein
MQFEAQVELSTLFKWSTGEKSPVVFTGCVHVGRDLILAVPFLANGASHDKLHRVRVVGQFE